FVLSVEAHAAASVQIMGDEPALVGIRTGNALARLHPAMGRARSAIAASHALLGLAEPDFLERYPRACIAAQLAFVSGNRGACGAGLDRACDGEATICRVGRVFEAHRWTGGPRRLNPPYKHLSSLARRADRLRGLLAHRQTGFRPRRNPPAQPGPRS